MTRLWRVVSGLLAALAAVPAVAGQAAGQFADPKTAFVQALAEFSVALDGHYGDEGRLVQSRLDSLDRGLERWDATIRTYESAMANDVRNAEPPVAARMHAALGAVYLDRSRIQDALREFATAAQLDPTRPEPHTLQGFAYSHRLANDPGAATRAFRQAAALDPSDPVRAYMLARQLTKIGSLDEARQEAKKARRLLKEGGKAGASPFVRIGLLPESTGIEPVFPPALYADGFALLQRGEYKQAIAQFREAIARDPLTTAAVQPTEAMGRAATAFRDGSVPDAVQHLDVAIELSPERAEAHRVLGLVLAADEQYDAALVELRSAIRLSPQDERARLALGDTLVEARRYPEAEQAFGETIRAFPASGRARYALGRLYQREGKHPEALRELQAAVGFNPLIGLNGIYEDMGAINAARQNFDAAIDAFTTRVDIHPNDPGAHQALGETYLRLGRHDEALAEFAVVLMLNPKHAEAYAAEAQVHLRDGRHTDAADASRRALALDPQHRQARYTLATSLIRLGQTDEGQKELATFERLQAETAAARTRELELGALRREASVSSASGDHEKAVTLLRKALVLEPNMATSHLNLGIALLNAKRAAEAIEHLNSAVALNAPFDVHAHLADAYAALGQLEDSRREQAVYESMKQASLRRTGNR